VEPIVIADRMPARVAAVLPAVVVALCVRVLTLGAPPVAERVAAAGVVAVCCWVAYRLLTVRMTVTDSGVNVRGVFYDAELPWSDMHGVELTRASAGMRLLLLGVMQPQVVALRLGKRVLRPVASVSGTDDDELERAVGAIRVRLGAWRVPTQRQPREHVTSR